MEKIEETLDLVNKKKCLRKDIKLKLKNFSSSENYLIDSNEISSIFLCSEIYKKSDLIFAFLHLPDEINIDKIINEALKAGKAVCIPKIVQNTNKMDFFYLDSKKDIYEQTVKGPYNINEPSPNLKKVVFDDNFPEKATMLVPGLLFSNEGKRLGRGKGFYDTYISNFLKKKKIFLCGICFSFQKKEDIPIESHDIILDCVISS